MVKPIYGHGIHKCRKCGGRAPLDKDEGFYRCLNCGHEQRELRAFYRWCEEHKKEILQDLLVIGLPGVKTKYQMPDVAWRFLYVRWGLRKIWVAPGMHFSSTDGIVKPPTFRHGWSDELKIKWFDVYHIYLEAIKK